MNLTPEIIIVVILLGIFFVYNIIKYFSKKNISENIIVTEIPKLLTEDDVKNKNYNDLLLSDVSSMPVLYNGNVSAIFLPHELIGVVQRKFDLFDEIEGYKTLISMGTLNSFLLENGIKISRNRLTKDPAFATESLPVYDNTLSEDSYISEYDQTESIPNENRNKKSIKYTLGKDKIVEVEVNSVVLYKSYMKKFWELLSLGIYPSKVAFDVWYKEVNQNPFGDEIIHTKNDSNAPIINFVKGNKDYYNNLYDKLMENNPDIISQ